MKRKSPDRSKSSRSKSKEGRVHSNPKPDKKDHPLARKRKFGLKRRKSKERDSSDERKDNE